MIVKRKPSTVKTWSTENIKVSDYATCEEGIKVELVLAASGGTTHVEILFEVEDMAELAKAAIDVLACNTPVKEEQTISEMLEAIQRKIKEEE